ncbi:MAG: hypothetical protein M3P83_06225, partial [Actinomycetota bacterium]|nr:hypothetical protein [Actinomycetota bacterium]
PLDTVVRLHLAILVLIRCPFSDQSRLPNGETASAAARHIEHHPEQFGLKEQPAYNLLQIGLYDLRSLPVTGGGHVR